jgi:hypothetical protein
MKRAWLTKFLISFCVLTAAICCAHAQANTSAQVKSRKVSEQDKIPVIIKHLPDWESARTRANYILNADELRKSVGERPILDLITFEGGTEAVSATYNQAQLLIVEYPTPQASVEADAQITQRLSQIPQNSQIFYRRIGNYNVFVFDAPDQASANALLDQIKYEKIVQWLDESPILQDRADREFAIGIGDVFLSTIVFVLAGLGVMLSLGTITGLAFYYVREHRRSALPVFSDAGGMIRLNLDELTSPISSGNLLNE